MESKKKSFARKVVAFFLAVIMAVSCFSAAFTAFAANTNREYNDAKLNHNIMAWADTTDEQTLEAVFDYLDTLLAGSNIDLNVNVNAVVLKIQINAKLRSIDDVIELLGNQVPTQLNKVSGLAGDLAGADFSAMDALYHMGKAGGTAPCGWNVRDYVSAKVIVKHLVKFLYDNSNKVGPEGVKAGSGTLIYKLMTGQFSLGGTVEGILKGSVYDKLRPMLGTPDGYQSDFFYNITKAMMLSKTGWFTKEEADGFNTNPQTWNIDRVTRQKVNDMWLPQISAWVTYTIYNHKQDAVDKPHTESSAERLDRIQAEMKKGKTYETACTDLGYDPNLHYCTIDTLENNINIFAYGNESVKFTEDTTLYSFAAQAFKLAWKTVLKDTLQLVHVNHDNWKQDGTPTNFDNDFFYFMRDNNKWIPATDKQGNATDAWIQNYTAANVQAWAEDRYPDCKIRDEKTGELRAMKDAAEFLKLARAEYETLSRTVIENPTYTWKDLQIMQFFNKLRYSPLADKYFDIRTGPLNLYLLQTGTPNTNLFIDAYATDLSANVNADGILDVINNGLVAMCKDLFVQGKNVGYNDAAGQFVQLNRPAFKETSVKFVKNSENIDAKIATVNAITDNFFMLIEYLLNTSDANILANLYNRTGVPFDATHYQLSEDTLEDSMLPLLIAAVNEVQINGQRLMDEVHDETWDRCKDVESVAVTVLEEHLAWVLPDKDYQGLYNFDGPDGKMQATHIFNQPLNGNAKTDYTVPKSSADISDQANVLEDVILVMARDAVGYQLAPILPLRHSTPSGYEAWSPYDSDVMNDSTTLYDLLNYVIVFYCGTNKWTDDNTESQGMAGVLGVVDKAGKCLVNLDNDLFTNCDNIVNHLLPFFGILQNGDVASEGMFETKELLIDVLVDGALEIKSKKNTEDIFEGDGIKNGTMSGLKVFLYQLLTIISCEPIMSYEVENCLYDIVLCPIINNVFGARYDDKFTHIIPTSDEMNAIYKTPKTGNPTNDKKCAGFTPIDSLFKKQVIACYDGKQGYSNQADKNISNPNGIGIIGILVDAVYKALGVNNLTGDVDNKEGIEGAWNGAAFICQSVANLDPYFTPQLKTHKFGVLSAEIANDKQTGLNQGGGFKATELLLKNNAVGLNRFYKNPDGTVTRVPRFVMNVTDVAVTNNRTSAPATNIKLEKKKADGILPQGVAKIGITGTTEKSDTEVYKFDITYDVYVQGEPTAAYSNEHAVAFLVLSTVKDYWNEVYKADGTFATNVEFDYNQKNNGNTNTSEACGVEAIDGAPHAAGTFPTQVIVKSSNPSQVDNMKWTLSDWRMGGAAAQTFRGLYFRFDDQTATASFIPKASNKDDIKPYGAEEYPATNYKNQPATEYKKQGGWGGKWQWVAGKGNQNELAYVEIDQTNGNILHHGWYDYFDPTYDNGDGTKGMWFRGGPDGINQHANTGAFTGYTEAQLNTADIRQKKVADPDDPSKQIELQYARGYEERTHVVWTYDEYMGGYDYCPDYKDDAVKYVKRTQVGLDAKKQPVYRYDFVLVRIGNQLNEENSGGVSFGTPIPGIYLTAAAIATGGNDVKSQTWMKYDTSKTLAPTPKGGITATVMVSQENCISGKVPVIFKMVDDSALKDITDQYNSVFNEFLPYKAEDFKTVSYQGKGDAQASTVNPFDMVQESLGEALTQSAKIINIKSADDFVSDKIQTVSTSATSSQIGEIARLRASENDAITPEIAVFAKLHNGYFYADKEFRIPILTAKEVTDLDVNEDPATVAVGGNDLVTGKTKVGNDPVVKYNGKWHFLNLPKYEKVWDTTTYDAPYLKTTTTQEGLKDKAPVFEKIAYTNYNDADGNLTNVVPVMKTIIRPNDGTEKRNPMEKAADKLTYWKEIALANLAGGGANRIITEVRDHFDKNFNEEYINFDVYSYNDLKNVKDEALALVTTKWVDSNRPIMDPINKDQQMVDPITKKPLWEKDPVYSTSASSLQVDNAIKEYNAAVKRLIIKDYTNNKVLEELAWSLANPTIAEQTYAGQGKDKHLESTPAAIEALNALSYTRSAGPVDKEGNPTEVFTDVKAPTAKFGTVDGGGFVVNKNAEGQQAYTDASWAEYMNALGKAICVAQNKNKAGTQAPEFDRRSDSFFARKQLMLAENNLDPFVPETSNEITISGTITIATDKTYKGTNPIANVNVLLDGKVVGTSDESGAFTAKVPAGTKQLTISGPTTIDRVVTISGNADISGVTIPICTADVARDGSINMMDFTTFMNAVSGTYDAKCDFYPDGVINQTDITIFFNFFDQKIVYPALALD